jgi:hypothetical protein
VTQSSGIAASQQFSNVYYTHNDRATNTQFYAVDGTGKLLGTYTMKTSSGANLAIFDFEEIQVGPGPSLSPAKALQSYVYAGEIGDNCHTRPYVAIHRGAEPGAGTGSLPATANVTMETLYLQYPVQCPGCTHESINSEAFLIDPITGGLFVIEKRCSAPSGTAACYTGTDKKSVPDPVGATDGINRVFFAPAPLDFGNTKNNPTQLQEITYIAAGADTGDCNLQAQAANGRITGAAVSPDGAFVALAFYDRIAFSKAEVRTDLGYTLSSWNWGFVTHMDVTREGVTFDRVPTKTSSVLSYPYFLTMEGASSKIMRGVVTVP